MKRIAVTLGLGGVLALCAVALASTALSGTYTTTLGKSTGKLAGSLEADLREPQVHGHRQGQDGRHRHLHAERQQDHLHRQERKDACPGKGVYQYSEVGRSLTFKRISDSNAKCAGRRTVLAATFTKKFSSSGQRRRVLREGLKGPLRGPDEARAPRGRARPAIGSVRLLAAPPGRAAARG